MTDPRIDDAMGLVLAGGRSERFGRNKALEPVHGIPMARHVYHTVASVIRDVRVGLSGPDDRNPVPGCAVVADDPVGTGPIGGLRAALVAGGGQWIFVTACDMPGVTPDAVRLILGARGPEVDAVVGIDPSGRLHPLFAAWHPRILEVVDQSLEDGRRSLTALLGEVRFETVPLPDPVLLNVNHPSDLPRST